MATPDQEQLISIFSSVTGADAVTAQHVLEAHAWDLNNGVEFFLEQGMNPCPPSLQEHPVSIDEDFVDVEEPHGPPARSLPQSRTASPPVQQRPVLSSHAVQHEFDGDDDMLQRALQESTRLPGAPFSLLPDVCPRFLFT